jgi:hypothetical protein
MEKTTIVMDNNRISSNGKVIIDGRLSEENPQLQEFSDMINFVSIDNRPEFFIDLLNSTFLNDTFMYNVTNTTASNFDIKDDKRDTIEFVLMSIVTIFLGLLILITIIGKRRRKEDSLRRWKLIDFTLR